MRPHEMLDQETGGKQRLEDCPLRLMRALARPQPVILIVDDRQPLPVRGAIDKAAILHIGGRDQQMTGHRQIAIDPLADRNIGIFRCHNPGKAPDRHNAPLIITGWKEIPVAKAVADHRIGDIIGGQCIFLDR